MKFSPDIESGIDDMVAIVQSPESTNDERRAALWTLIEAYQVNPQRAVFELLVRVLFDVEAEVFEASSRNE